MKFWRLYKPWKVRLVHGKLSGPQSYYVYGTVETTMDHLPRIGEELYMEYETGIHPMRHMLHTRVRVVKIIHNVPQRVVELVCESDDD